MLYGTRNEISLLPHYISTSLRITPTNHQRFLLHKKMMLYNNSIKARISDLHAGLFNNVRIPFNIRSYTAVFPYELPYDALLKGWSLDAINGRLISPRIMNLRSRWPLCYTNKSLYEDFSTYEFHCSLTPVIAYETLESMVEFKRNFDKLMKDMDEEEKQKVHISFSGNLEIFTKVNYEKYFMVFPISQETEDSVKNLHERLNGLRFLQDDLGSISGESTAQEQRIKKLERLHITTGICSLPYNETDNHLFGMYELYYLNEVLLKPKNELLERFGKDSSNNALKYISDVEFRLTQEEIEELKFVASEIMLTTTGSQLRYKLK